MKRTVQLTLLIILSIISLPQTNGQSRIRVIDASSPDTLFQIQLDEPVGGYRNDPIRNIESLLSQYARNISRKYNHHLHPELKVELLEDRSSDHSFYKLIMQFRYASEFCPAFSFNFAGADNGYWVILSKTNIQTIENSIREAITTAPIGYEPPLLSLTFSEDNHSMTESVLFEDFPKSNYIQYVVGVMGMSDLTEEVLKRKPIEEVLETYLFLYLHARLSPLYKGAFISDFQIENKSSQSIHSKMYQFSVSFRYGNKNAGTAYSMNLFTCYIDKDKTFLAIDRRRLNEITRILQRDSTRSTSIRF